MDKKEVAAIFEEIALLLELKGANPFRIRAYRNAARAVLSVEEDLRTLVDEKRLTELAGIGDDLAEKITKLVKTGRLPFYEKLKKSIPKGIIAMMQVHGLGGKKIKVLHQKLKIKSIEELKLACERGKLSKLRGFGPKTEKNILESLQHRETYQKRHLWWEAMAIAQPIVEALRKLKEVKKVELAGSLRRKLETIGDLDILVASSHPQSVMNWFTSQPFVARVLGKGETKTSIKLQGGMQADLRIVSEDQFEFALAYFTGSKEHNIKLRERSIRRGWTLSEYGLEAKKAKEGIAKLPAPEKSMILSQFAGVEERPELRCQGHTRESRTWRRSGKMAQKRGFAGAASFAIPSKGPFANAKKRVTENDIYKALGLSFIPPELREDRTEIEAAEIGKLPVLVEEGDIRGTFHNHTTASDGRNSLKEMVAATQKLGWEYIGIADHSKSSFQAHGQSEEELLKQVEEIRKINASGSFKPFVFAGVECDILADGKLDFSDRVLKMLDYVVISIHSSLQQDEKTMTKRIIRAIEHPLTTMLGHLTGRLLLKREGYKVNVPKVIDACIANKKIMELNANPMRLDMDWRWWHYAANKGLMCCINTDAHSIDHLLFFRAGVNAARKGWLEKKDILNTRPLAQVRKILANL